MDENKEQIKPNFIGIGAMKCATTWISECLRYHPEIYMSSPKEIHFFSAYYDKGLDWYLNHFQESKAYKAIGEFSITYLPNKEVPARIMKTIGEVKILVSLRNPVDRFISHYKHYLRSGKVEDNLNLENYKKAIKDYPQLLDRGNYSKQLEKYIDIFGLGNIKIIIKEKIDFNPEKVLNELYSFLDVDSEFVPSLVKEKVSPGTIPKVKFLENIRIKIHSWAKKYAPWFIDFVKKYRLTELYRKINNKKSFQVDPVVKNKLYEYYKDEIIKTKKLIRKDLSIWEK